MDSVVNPHSPSPYLVLVNVVEVLQFMLTVGEMILSVVE